ncbi:MAG: MFS transporter [Desulfovibrionales bacterium]|nr:MFS transporter [Desulfovibrionales bacterium]
MNSTQKDTILYQDKMSKVQIKAVWIMMFLYFCFYFAKYNMSAATKPIQDAFGFSSAEFGIVFTVFTAAYAFGQFFSGFLADRYNAKVVMLIGVMGSLCANIMFGMSSALGFFILFWGANALSMSLGWAPGCNILYNWLPPKRWGIYMGFFCAVCYAGGAVVLPISAKIVSVLGWKGSFFVTPLFLAAMALVFLFMVKPSPEAAGYRTDWKTAVSVSEKVTGADYWTAFSHPKMIMAYVTVICANFVRWGLINWIVKILNEPLDSGGYGLTLVMAGLVGSMIHWGGAVFSVVFGWLSDKVFKGIRWQSILIGFAISGGALLLLSKGPAILNFPAGIFLLCALLFVSGGVIQAVQAPLFSLPGDILGDKLGATGSGVMNGWSYVGASFSGVFLGWIMDSSGFMAGILFLAVICGVGSALALTIRR